MERNGKTIKQLADEIGVSKTAIRKKLTDEIRNQFAETIGNTVFISEEGESLLKSAFRHQNENQVSGNQMETVSVLVSMLQSELEIKNEQIKELNARLAESSAALAGSQALHAGTIQQRLITDGNANGEDKPTLKERFKYLFKRER